jgi:hypothetical protein
MPTQNYLFKPLFKQPLALTTQQVYFFPEDILLNFVINGSAYHMGAATLLD